MNTRDRMIQREVARCLRNENYRSVLEGMRSFQEALAEARKKAA